MLKEFIQFIQNYRQFGSYWFCFLGVMVLIGLWAKFCITHQPLLLG